MQNTTNSTVQRALFAPPTRESIDAFFDQVQQQLDDRLKAKQREYGFNFEKEEPIADEENQSPTFKRRSSY